MPKAPSAAAHYRARNEHAERERLALTARSNAFSLARVVTAAAILATIVWGAVQKTPKAWPLLGAVLAVFIVLLVLHDRVLSARARAERLLAWTSEGLARLAGRFARAPLPGELDVEASHAYADDLDVMSKGGLLQSIDTTRTPAGRALLASWLLAPASDDEVRARQEAAAELADRVEVREALAVEGAAVAKDPPKVKPLLQWISEAKPFAPSALARVSSFALPALVVVSLFGRFAVPLPEVMRVLWLPALLIAIGVTSAYRVQVQAALSAASQHASQLARWQAMIAAVENLGAKSAALDEIERSLASASTEVAALARIVTYVDARQNEVFRLLIGPALMWDFHCARALERWRLRAGSKLAGWLDAVAHVEALSALATRAHERPDHAWPTLLARSDAPSLEASSLAHPLLGEEAVANDVSLGRAASGDEANGGHVLLVTGSNMSGKSTLMRAIGSNVVLALAGAPVRAKSMTLCPFAVSSSMRVRDDLASGVSHFFAELRKIKSVLDAADRATASERERPVLFLLDEILHGTNSRERHLGARAIVRHLVRRRACGAVSTHDLALASLESELPGRVRNVHFRELITRAEDGTETMSFDYALRQGPVTSSNALRLMKLVGIELDDELAEEPAHPSAEPEPSA